MIAQQAAAGATPQPRRFFSSEFLLFGGLAVAWLLGFDWFLADRYRVVNALPPGVLTMILELCLEAWVIVALFRDRRHLGHDLRYFLWFFGLLLPSDIGYLTLHYILRQNQENWLTFFLTTLPYSVAYVVGCAGFYKHIGAKLAKSRWVSFIWLPILLIVPAIFGILLPLLVAHHSEAGLSFDLLEIAFNSIFAVVFFFWSTVTLLMSLEGAFAFLGLAGIISQLGNWGGVSAYLLHQNTFTFGEYEFLWLCGIVTFWYSLVVIRRFSKTDPSSTEPSEPEAARHRSLVIQQRMTIIGLISASLIGAVLLSRRDVWSYRIVFFGIALGSYVSLLIGELLSKQIIHYATLFGKIVNLTARQDSFPAAEEDIPSELWQVYRMAFEDDAVQHRMKEAVRQNLAELSSQVAHDIRSPLVALDSVVKDASQLPEEKRIIVRSAVGRIRDIANSLLDKHRQTSAAVREDAGSASAEEPAAACLLSSLIEPLITEKRMRYRSLMGVEIDSRMDESSYGLFAKVQPVEFKRALSNLIDNGVEALQGAKGGLVLVTLSSRNSAILVRIQDNGKGIPPDLLGRLGARGESHGKAQGSGLGLYHARSRAEAWGGRLEIASEAGRGTTITLVLPPTPPPAWFVSELQVAPGQPLVILDDDASIHQVWRGRFESLRGHGPPAETVHISTPADIRKWTAANGERSRNALYLLDYELLGYDETGLSLAKELGIGKRTVLVTSRSEEPDVLRGCLELGARMIPKSLAGLVPIRVGTAAPGGWDAVFIDDDALARMTWQMSAERAGKRLLALATPAEFFEKAPGLDRGTAIYVDQELGEGMKGEAVALLISQMGFVDVYLATGHEAALRPGRHVKGVLGKEPPWDRELLAA